MVSLTSSPVPGPLSNQRFRGALPVGCPPDSAEEISTIREVYRLVRTDPPIESEDFASLRAKNPSKPPFRDSRKECEARGLSVWCSRAAAERHRKSTRRLRGLLVCRVRLGPGAGYIERTGSNRSHFTWWPLVAFDILSECTVVEAA